MDRPSRSSTSKGLRFAAGLFLLLLLLLMPVPSDAGTFQLSPEIFLVNAFGDAIPAPRVAWLVGERGDVVETILGRKPDSLRIRYWRLGARSAWILDDIGKEKPITAGFVIERGKLVDVKVLAFRESRGWEIRQDFFTQQFNGVTLNENHDLSRAIDNITGATLSVNAMRRMSKIALYLAQDIHDVTP